MGARVVGHALHALGGVHQLLDALVGLERLLEFGRHLERLVQRLGAEGNHAGYAVGIGVAHAQDAPHVSDGGLWPQGAEGDNLGHTVLAVLAGDVGQHLVPPVVLEVHVNIGHLLALQVQEALEDQAVLQGVDVGHAQAVEGEGCGGAAPHAEQDVALMHKGGDVPHDQEVVGEAGLADYVQLVLQPLLDLCAGAAEPVPQPLPAQARQVGVGVLPLGRYELRDVRHAEVNGHVALLGDALAVLNGLRQVREKLRHLLVASHVVGVVLHAEALLVLDGGVGLDAYHDVLDGSVRLDRIVGVVGCHQRQAGLPR